MKFLVMKASEMGYKGAVTYTIEINSIKEIKDLCDQYAEDLVISFRNLDIYDVPVDGVITIYDYYLE